MQLSLVLVDAEEGGHMFSLHAAKNNSSDFSVSNLQAIPSTINIVAIYTQDQ